MRSSSLLFFVALLPSLPARADDTGVARALAEQGVAAVKAGDYTGGCPKLAEAWRLDGQLLGAGVSLSSCHERDGKLASAWSVLSTVAARAAARGEAIKAKEAQARADELKPRMSLLTVVVPEGVSKLDGLVVLRDGQALGVATFGVALPVDGGTHVISVSAVGRGEWKTTVEVPKELGKVVVTASEPPPAETPLAQTPSKKADPDPPKPPPGPPVAPPEQGVRPTVVGAIALGIIGGVTMAVGVGLGAEASGQYQAAPGCAGDVCGPAGFEARRNALTVADAGTASFVVGAVLGATGIALGVVAALTGKRPASASSLQRLEWRF